MANSRPEPTGRLRWIPTSKTPNGTWGFLYGKNFCKRKWIRDAKF